jgi:hypothetical protein
MAVANAVGRRGSHCATAAPLKSPMMAWGTFRGGYFRVADDSFGMRGNDCHRLYAETLKLPFIQTNSDVFEVSC